MRPATSADPLPIYWIDDEVALAELVEELADQPRLAVDTEFHREKTYFAQLALMQIAWERGIALVDPLAVDVAALGPVLSGDALIVMHAADQDLEILDRDCGTVPRRLFDTQLAAGFTGQSSPSLTNLAERLVGVRLPKGDRLTDWCRRPLDDDQRSYAASDVAHLLAMHDALVADLTKRGRLEWAEDECVRLLTERRTAQDPDTAWWRIKDSRSLRGPSRGVAQEVGAWRERRAARLDIPARYVLPDLALVAIAHRPPKSRRELEGVRGLDARQVQGQVGEEIMAAIERGRVLPPESARLPPESEVERDVRPAVTLVSAWISQLGRDLQIETTLLATRSDLAAFLRDDPAARLRHGWRADLVGERVRRLVDGDAALAFEGDGRLVLEERSRVPVGDVADIAEIAE